MKHIPLKAISITFNELSITYGVELPKGFKGSVCNIPFCANTIKEKELILLPTLIDKDNLEIHFACSNVFPSFYQALMESKLYDVDEFRTELKNIYQVGDIVGYIMLD